MKKVGETVPAFRAKTTQGKFISSSDYLGKYWVVYFYPKAFTSGCTRETIQFQQAYAEIQKLGAELVGVSTDKLDEQCSFAKKNNLGFPLIPDENADISIAFGVFRRLFKVDQRATFIIDPKGKIVAVFHYEIFVGKHTEEVMNFLRKNRISGI